MMCSSLKSRSGFTLVELMVALFLTVLAVVAMYRSYVAIRIGMEIQEQQAEIHQTLRIGVQRMVRELRMATYDPEGNAEAGFVIAEDTEIRFTCDLNDDGDVDDNDEDGAPNGDLFADEDVTYSWTGTDGDPLVRSDNNGGTTTNIINNVSGLKFIYLSDEDNDVPPDGEPDLLSKPLSAFQRTKIRNIEIILVTKATNSAPGYRNFKVYESTRDEDDSGTVDTVFTGPGDNFRRGRLVALVKARNAGLN